MTTVAICLCFKDSADYLDEWIRFHVLQGVQRFYLYNNGSVDDWLSVVEAWRHRVELDVIDYPGVGVQQEIYDDCLRRARGQVEWLAFLDDDEFLFSPEGHPIAEALAGYRNFAGVAVSWVMFGSGGANRKTPEWVIDRFRLSAGIPDHHVKCVVRPDQVLRSKVIGHSFVPLPGRYLVDENKIAMIDSLAPHPSAQKLRINHYLVKSWEEWRTRRLRPTADTGEIRTQPEAVWREWDKEWSRVPDELACEFLVAMRAL